MLPHRTHIVVLTGVIVHVLDEETIVGMPAFGLGMEDVYKRQPTIISISAFSNSSNVGLILNCPSIRATRTSEIGFFQECLAPAIKVFGVVIYVTGTFDFIIQHSMLWSRL